MILTNTAILHAIGQGYIKIKDLAGMDPTRPPFNTTAVDLRLADAISVPKDGAFAYDLSKSGIAQLIQTNSEHMQITNNLPFALKPNHFILAQTLESVSFPFFPGTAKPCYCARVEGKSSVARCGVLVHFTAPTIHAEGRITLEMINLGKNDFLLRPNMPICQLIIEEVIGTPMDAPNQFKGQLTPAGVR